MKKAIVVVICAALGVAAGFVAAPIAAEAYVQSAEPDLFGAFYIYLVDSFTFCNCDKKPPAEMLQTAVKSVSILKTLHEHDPKSQFLSQELALTQVRASLLEQKLGEEQQAKEDMKLAQDELSALGWKDVSPTRLTAIVAQIESEYGPAKQTTSFVTTTR
jgi:hypothetical protein